MGDQSQLKKPISLRVVIIVLTMITILIFIFSSNQSYLKHLFEKNETIDFSDPELVLRKYCELYDKGDFDSSFIYITHSYISKQQYTDFHTSKKDSTLSRYILNINEITIPRSDSIKLYEVLYEYFDKNSYNNWNSYQYYSLKKVNIDWRIIETELSEKEALDFFNNSHYQKSAKICREIRKINFYSPFNLFLYGKNMIKLPQEIGSQEALDQMIELLSQYFPYYPKTFELKGAKFEHLQMPEVAIEYYKEGLELPQSPESKSRFQMKIAHLYISKIENYQKARIYLDEAINNNPNDYYNWLLCGVLNHLTNDLLNSIKCYKKAIEFYEVEVNNEIDEDRKKEIKYYLYYNYSMNLYEAILAGVFKKNEIYNQYFIAKKYILKSLDIESENKKAKVLFDKINNFPISKYAPQMKEIGGENKNVQYINENWLQVELDNIVKISYPSDDLEIQAGKLKDLAEASRKAKGYLISLLTLQQIGLNDNIGNNPYVRVIVGAELGGEGEFLKANTNVSDLTSNQKTAITKYYESKIEQDFINNDLKILKKYPSEFIIVNDNICVHLSYMRSSTLNPAGVIVNCYFFQDNNREISLIMSCLQTNYSKWEADFDKILQSFTILK